MARTGFPAIVAAAMGIAVCFSIQPAAAAEPQCGPHASVLRQLADKFGETVVAGGVTANGLLLEVLSSEGGGKLDRRGALPGRPGLPAGRRAELALSGAGAGRGA